MAVQANARAIVVESDNKQVVDLIKSRKSDGTTLGMISHEIHAISSFFVSVHFLHIFREANLAAHTMAHLNPLDYSTQVWVGSCPSVLDDVIASDFCLINNNN